MKLIDYFFRPNVWILKSQGDAHRLIRALGSGDPAIREQAAVALGQIGDSGAVNALITALKNKSPGVRRWTIKSLGKIGDERAVPALLDVMAELGPSNPEVGLLSSEAATALVAIGHPAVTVLARILGNKKSRARNAAVEVLRRIGDKDSIDVLKRALVDGNEGVRSSAAHALETLGWTASTDEENIGYLIATKSWDELTKVKSQSAAPYIDVLQREDTDFDYQAAAISSLLGNEEASRFVWPFKRRGRRRRIH